MSGSTPPSGVSHCTDEVEPVASVIIPTWNRADLLGVALRSVLRQDLSQPYEVVVIDDGSTDDTRSVVDEARGGLQPTVTLRYEWQPNRGLNSGRNRGLELARSPLICFIDDDVKAPASWLPALVEGATQYEHAQALGGPILLRIEGREPRHCSKDRLPETHLDRGNELVWDKPLFGANLTVRRNAIERVGGFRTDLRGHGDEEEWERRLLRSGGHTLYLPDAWLWHRRVQRDLGRRHLMRRSYRQGFAHVPYLMSAGMAPTARGEAWTIIRGLGHALCLGCFYGVLRACRAWGKLRGIRQLRKGTRDPLPGEDGGLVGTGGCGMT